MNTKDQLEEIRTGKQDLSSYIRICCDLLEAENPQVHAIVETTYDRDRIEADVARLIERFPDPTSRPALFGLPIGVKDIIRVDGLPTKCGSRLPDNLFSGPEADCVTRMKRAGAIVIAKTVTTEFAAFQPGPTCNPHRFTHTPGGSSSGSAAAVSKGFFPFGFGTQTIGSIARPAAFCGVVGFKPSWSRIATGGVVEYSRTMDHVGWLCNDTSALSQLAGVLIANWNPAPRIQNPNDVVIGIPEGPYLEQASNPELQRFSDLVARLQGHHLTIRSCPALQNIEQMRQEHLQLVNGELARVHHDWYARYSHDYAAKTAELIETGQHISDKELRNLIRNRSVHQQQLEQTMDHYQLDYWIAPGAVDLAPEGLDSTGDPIMSLPWTHTGLPTVSIPARSTFSDLPHGIQLVGRFGKDEQLVEMASEIAKRLHHSIPETT
ncbi:MAG: amidase [Planctomycetaceae bacterium]|nr:amidase [Planctomycetaceae bacterium]